MSPFDKAKTLNLLAPYLSEARRTEIAEAIAEDLAPPAKRPGRMTAAEQLDLHGLAPDRDIAVSEPVVQFLLAEGYREADLVRASGRLCSAVRRRRAEGWAATLTPSSLAEIWEAERA